MPHIKLNELAELASTVESLRIHSERLILLVQDCKCTYIGNCADRIKHIVDAIIERETEETDETDKK